MTSTEIRQSESGESQLGNETAFWLREIAAQLAELNERSLAAEMERDAMINTITELEIERDELARQIQRD